MKIDNIEEVVRPAVKELLKEINTGTHVSIINMKFLVRKGIVDADEYKAFVEQELASVEKYLKSVNREDEATVLVSNINDYLKNF